MPRKNVVRRFIIVLLAAVGLLIIWGAMTPSAQTQSQITSPIDDSSRVVIPHSAHPLARAEYDQGPVEGTLSMEQLALVLKSSPEKESQSRALLDSQHRVVLGMRTSIYLTIPDGEKPPSNAAWRRIPPRCHDLGRCQVVRVVRRASETMSAVAIT
jgi:hypothetical protein